MIELPEAINLAKQMRETVRGKTVSAVYPPSSPHKFCWFNHEPEEYQAFLAGHTVTGAAGFGIFSELEFDSGVRLCFNDGVNPRFIRKEEVRPKKYQLLLEFTDGSAIAFTVAMYGSISCHSGDYDNEYYRKSIESISPLTEEFVEGYFNELLASVKPAMSVKAFLATEQRIPGLGNGCLQNILFQAGIHPKRKVSSLSDCEKNALWKQVKTVLQTMTEQGGRDTEKDLFGNPGGYQTLMSKNTLASGCPACGGEIVKETYLGGAVYYCPSCQKMEEEKR